MWFSSSPTNPKVLGSRPKKRLKNFAKWMNSSSLDPGWKHSYLDDFLGFALPQGEKKWVDTCIKGPTKLVSLWRKEKVCPKMEQLSSSTLKFWNCVRYLEYSFPGSIILKSRLYVQFQEGDRWLSSNGSLFYSSDGPMLLHQWFWVWSLDQ